MPWLLGASKLLPLIVAAVHFVERLSTAKGKDKQDAAIEGVGLLVPLLENALDRDLLNEREVQEAMRKVIDSYVLMQNVIRDVKAKRSPTSQ